MGKLSTLTMVGVYAAGTRLLTPLEMIPDSLATALVPMIARGSQDSSVDVGRLLQRVFFVLVLFGLPVAIGGLSQSLRPAARP